MKPIIHKYLDGWVCFIDKDRMYKHCSYGFGVTPGCAFNDWLDKYEKTRA